MKTKTVELGDTRGTAVFLNWAKLTELLRRTGNLKPNEFIKGVNINEAGFGAYVGDDPEDQTPL